MAEVVQDEISIEIKSKADDAAKSVKTLSGELKSLNTVISGLGFAGLFKGLKQIGSTMFSFAEKMSNYIQTMNQFKIVMGDSTKEAEAFINKAEDILGLDPQKLQTSLATFKSLAETFGISSDNAYKMSQNLTQLAADMSTFKGISFDQALQKIKSGFVGEIEPMRAVGIALDKATLQETANRLGIEQRIDAMTRAQKTELLYYQMMTATEQMQGNMAKNLLTPATAIRQIQTEFVQLGRAIGSIFIPLLMKVAPYIRAITELASEAAQAIAAMFGFELGDYSVGVNEVASGLSDVGSGISDIGTGAGKAAKELNKMLMPFDELNNINLENKTGGSGGGSIGGVGGSLGIPIKEYDMFANASDEMRKKIDKIKESIKKLLPVIKNVAIALAALWAAKKILDFISYISGIVNAFKTLKTVATSLFTSFNGAGILSIIARIAAAIGGIILSIKGIIDMNNVITESWRTGTIDAEKYSIALVEMSVGFGLIGAAIGGLHGALIGLAVGAIAGLVSALFAGTEQSSQYMREAEKLNEVVAKQKELVDKDAESWDNLSKTTEENVSKQLGQIDNVETLVDELGNLVDANGKVKDADKARVDFILNELNQALGTEYKLTGNQITQNGKEAESLEQLKNSIQKVIDKKKAEAIIDATADKYAEALLNKTKYYGEAQDALKKQTEAAQKMRDFFKEYNIDLDKISAKELEVRMNADMFMNQDYFKRGMDKVAGAYNDATGSLQKATKMWQESSETIINIEGIKTAALEENYDDVEKYINNLTKTYEINGKKQQQTVESSLNEQLDTYTLYYNGMDETAKKSFDYQLQKTVDALVAQTNEVTTLTPENIEAWANLSKKSNEVYNDNISKVSEGTQLAIKTAIGELDANSPETIQKWKNLAKTSETEYEKALSLLPEDTRNQIIQSASSIYGQAGTLNSAGSWAGDTVASSANYDFRNNLDLQITSSDVTVRQSGFYGIGQRISGWIQNGISVLLGMGNIQGYASGGFPETGQLFMANEAGPELVGNIGRKTAVANQGQITEGIAAATYNAMSKALAENKSNGNSNPYIVVNLGNETLYNGYGSYQDRQSNMYGVAL